MLTEKETDQVAQKMSDELMIDEFVEPVRRTHHDQYVHHTHELSEDSSESASRALVRGVPLAYGVLLGGLADNMVLGLLGGMALSVAFDLYMGNNSMARALSRRLFINACPVIAAAAHRLADAIRRIGLAAPSALSGMQCGAAPT